MLTITLILTIMTSLIIIYQDFKSRLLSVSVLGLMLVAIVMHQLLDLRLSSWFQSSLVNLTIVSLQLIAMHLYMRIKMGSWTTVINRSYGLGDLVLILIYAVALPTFYFMLFQLMSLVLAMAGFLFVHMKRKQTIPLAAYYAMGFVPFWMANHLIGEQQILAEILQWYHA